MESTVEFDVVEHLEVIERAAHVVANKYPGKFDWEDIRQSICEAVLKNPKSFAKAEETGVLFPAFTRAGYRYCQEETLAKEYFSDAFNYSVEEVKALMAEYFRHVSAQSFGDYLIVDKWEDKETVQVVLKFVDFEDAFQRCRATDHRAFTKRHLYGETLKGADKTAYSRGIRRLTGYINHEVNKLVFERGKSFHEGPMKGRLPSPESIEVRNFEADTRPNEVDAVDEYQRIMESIY